MAVVLFAAGPQPFTFAPCTFAQDDFEEESPYAPGLVATIRGAEGTAATEPITRIDESLAFDWESAAPDSRLPAGNFTATWRGRLWTQAPGRYQLAVYTGGGSVSLRLAGKEVLTGDAAAAGWIRTEPLELEFGRHDLEVSFRRTAAPARLALYWSGPNFVLEPVPARFLMHDREASPAHDFERGRTLAAALRCEACHGGTADSTVLAAPALAAPALEKLSGNLDPLCPERGGIVRCRRVAHAIAIRESAGVGSRRIVAAREEEVGKGEVVPCEAFGGRGAAALSHARLPRLPSARRPGRERPVRRRRFDGDRRQAARGVLCPLAGGSR